MDPVSPPPPEIIPVYGEVCIRKQRRKRQKKLLILLFLDFAKNTTLHGLRYITEAGLHIVEKIFWFVTFFLSVTICFFFIFDVWYKWQNSPVIVSFNAKHVSVDEIPFPSVTICSQIKFSQRDFNYTDILNDYKKYKCNSINVKTFNAISLVCDNPQAIEKTTSPCEDGFLDAWDMAILEKVSLSRIFKRKVMWKNELQKHLFRRVLTDDGVCFNFNGLSANELLSDEVQTDFNLTHSKQKIKNWSFSDGYTSSPDDSYPFRGENNAATANLDFLMKCFEDVKDSKCNNIYNGYKIYLHHPADYPQALLYHFAALPKQLTSMGVKFTVETANPTLKKYPVDLRQCYFPGDKHLRYFKIYTYNNCILECLTNYTYNQCGCVGFYMPYHDSSKICSARHDDYTCFTDAKANFTKFKEGAKRCQCLPTCDFIDYDAEIHKTDYLETDDLSATFNASQPFNLEKSPLSRVQIFFKRPMFRSVHRNVLFGLTDFLGNCGGLLGLFLGFSWLSLVEIFYFLTFRVYNTIKTDLRNEKCKGKKKNKPTQMEKQLY